MSPSNQPTRRTVLQAASGALLAAGGSYFVRGAAPKDRPNLILAIADDWGYPHAGAYGYKAARTPVFDQLARDGILFQRAYCAAPTCTASRGSILTGQAPHRLEEGANLWSHLPAKFKVYPDLLEAAGYTVGAYRKAWGPGKVIDRPRPPGGPQFKSFEDFLKTVKEDAPFCFWFGAQDPHRPYERSFGEKSGIDPKDVEIPPYLPDTPEVRLDVVDYLAEVQRFDSELGTMLESLKGAGRADNTLIIVTGDNGWPFPRGKATCYDPGIHQPFAARWPGRIKPGQATDYLTVLTDIAPTFLAAAGLEIPADMTGQNLLPVMTGHNPPAREFIVCERERHAACHAGNVGYPIRAIRTDRYLYIRNFEPERWPAGDPDSTGIQGAYGDIDAGPTKQLLLDQRSDPAIGKFFEMACGKRPAEELFDLQADPQSIRNLAADPQHAATKKELADKLLAWMKQTADPRAADPHYAKFDQYPYHANERPAKKPAGRKS